MRKLNEFFSFMSKTFTGAFGLRVYGESLLTPRVGKEMVSFSFVLFIQFLIDIWAWSMAWQYALPDSPVWSWVLGTVFGTAILLMDRSVIVADTSKSLRQVWPLFGRFVLLVGISFITAIPVELAVFHSEIENRIASQEKAAVDGIKTRALNTEKTKYFAEVEKARADLANVDTKVSTDDVESYKAQRATERDKLVKAQADQRATFQKDLDAKSERAALEAAGKGPSGRYGRGPAMKEMRKQEKEAAARFEKFNLGTAKPLTDFDETTRKEVTRLQEKRDTDTKDARQPLVAKVTRLEAEREAALEALRMMDADSLAQKYGGSWRQSRGFLDRYRHFSSMQAEDSVVFMLAWGCRLMMILIGIVVLTLKLMCSDEFRRYYSFGCQVVAGHPGAVATAESMGFNNVEARRALGFDAGIRRLISRLEDKQLEAAKAIDGFRREQGDQATKKDVVGLCQPRTTIEASLRTYWEEKIAPTLHAIELAESNLRLTGFFPPSWPKTLGNGIDPRQVKDPWKFTDAMLASYGWLDPESIKQDGRRAQDELTQLRLQLVSVWQGLRESLMDLINRSPRMPRESFVRNEERRRHDVYKQKIMPILAKMAEVSDRIKKAGLEVSAWPQNIENPMEGIEMCWKIPEDTVLRKEFAWAGPPPADPVKPEVKPVVVPPPSVQPVTKVKPPEVVKPAVKLPVKPVVAPPRPKLTPKVWPFKLKVVKDGTNGFVVYDVPNEVIDITPARPSAKIRGFFPAPKLVETVLPDDIEVIPAVAPPPLPKK